MISPFLLNSKSKMALADASGGKSSRNHRKGETAAAVRHQPEQQFRFLHTLPPPPPPSLSQHQHQHPPPKHGDVKLLRNVFKASPTTLAAPPPPITSASSTSSNNNHLHLNHSLHPLSTSSTTRSSSSPLAVPPSMTTTTPALMNSSILLLLGIPGLEPRHVQQFHDALAKKMRNAIMWQHERDIGIVPSHLSPPTFHAEIIEIHVHPNQRLSFAKCRLQIPHEEEDIVVRIVFDAAATIPTTTTATTSTNTGSTSSSTTSSSFSSPLQPGSIVSIYEPIVYAEQQQTTASSSPHSSPHPPPPPPSSSSSSYTVINAGGGSDNVDDEEGKENDGQRLSQYLYTDHYHTLQPNSIGLIWSLMHLTSSLKV